jgi:antitoxin YefM
MTRHISYADFRSNLARYMDEVSDGPLHIDRATGSVVMISEDEFQGWQETLYLLQSPTNAQNLLSAIKAADAGGLVEHGPIGDP